MIGGSDEGQRPDVPTIEVRGIVKRFGAVCALSGASFTVYPREVVALIGDNGAGKSTLVKILAGVQAPDEGEMLINGEPVRFSSPLDAQRFGIETVYQDLALAPDLDAASNMYLGKELVKGGLLGRCGVLDRRRMRTESTSAFRKLGVALPDASTPIAGFSGGQRQGVAVSRAVMWASRVVIMDEPTAALGVVQTEKVLDLVGRVRDAGLSVILISHNMTEVLEVADRIEVLRLGRRVAQYRAADSNVSELVGAMTGAVDEESVG